MEYKQIEKLLEKYFEGQTSLEEERSLKAFFRNDQVPKHLLMYKGIFNYFDEAAELKCAPDFDKKLEARINNKTAKIVPFKYKAMRVAAAILVVVIAVWWGTSIEKKSTQLVEWDKYEIEDPELAKEALFDALALVSNKYSKAESKAAQELLNLKKINIKSIKQ